MALPIIFGNLGFILIGVGDVVVAGRHSTDTLSSISIATAFTNSIMIFGIGILTIISAVLSNYRGKKQSIEKYFYPSLKFSLILSVIVSIIILSCIPFIDKLGFEQKLVPMIKNYFFITAFATFGGYIHCMAKEFLQAFEIVVFPNILTILCIFLNVGLNIIFAFGYGIIPELGASGLAIASLITRYFMALVLIIYCYNKLQIQKGKITGYYKVLIKLGLPSSLAIFIEFVGFNIVSIIMGRISGLYAAAHNILTTLTSVTFMIPLAISNATAVKVGYTNGAKYIKSLKRYAYTGIGISIIFMAFSAIILWIFAHVIIKFFTNDIELIKVCIPIIYVLCFFQVFDGLQVTLTGIFKGLKKTKTVMISNLISYWLIAFPIGCLLGLHFKLNLLGFWYSICLSAIILCSILLTALHKKFRYINF